MAMSDGTLREIGRLLVECFSVDASRELLPGFLHLHYTDDEWQVSLILDGGKAQVHALRPTLLDALQAASRRTDLKTCGQCKERKPLPQFARSNASPDGRCQRCRRCEVLRVAEYDQRVREQTGKRRVTKS